ncbi:MAG: 7-carboxy-7-deazaguanine synthase [Planctomycetota bacterium]|nr:MAG: 7-carboxy-7-deazaguanine synthase [Planctomycetota bacterium]
MSVTAASPQARVAEVFRSWQGEGLLLGKRQVFVRLAGCEVGCRFCDTEWAFDTPARVAVPNRAGEHLSNPLSVAQVVDLVNAADPLDAPGGLASVTLTGGEPTEQLELLRALCPALTPRELMLETAGLNGPALHALAPWLRWIALDIKLPTASGLADALQRHAEAFANGLPAGPEIFVKLVVDGDTPVSELQAAADLLRARLPSAPIFLQPVSPLGGSPALPAAHLDRLAEPLLAAGLDLRVVPQVHKVLKVR